MNTHLSTRTSEECPACEVARASGARFCPQCGEALTLASAEVPAPDTGLPEEPSVRSDKPPDVEPCVTLENGDPSGGTGELSLASAPEPPDVCSHCGHEAESTLRLVLDDGNGNRIERKLGESPIVIGKDETCDVVIHADTYVSHRHARASLDQGLCFLEDLGSSNGTLLRIQRPVVIEPGDEIVVGSTVIRLVNSTSKQA